MSKVLVEVYSPALQQHFDVSLPCNMKLYEATSLISKLLLSISGDAFKPSGDEVLCDETGAILNINLSVGSLGLRNGSRLMLI